MVDPVFVDATQGVFPIQFPPGELQVDQHFLMLHG